MLMIQVKVSKKGGIVVIDPSGEMHPCIEPDDLWDTMHTLVGAPPAGTPQPVDEAVFLQVKVRRNTIILIDPLAELHQCKDAHDLWDTVADLIENEDMPQATTMALARQAPTQVVNHERVQVIHEGDERRMHTDEVRDAIEEMVGDAAADLGTKLFSRLRGMSHRGAAPTPGGRRPRKRVKRGDIY